MAVEEKEFCDNKVIYYLNIEEEAKAVSYTHLTLPTTPYV